METCAVIPAAGLGSRLNFNIPKLLLPLTRSETVWTMLRQKLNLVDHIHVIVSPQGESLIRQALQQDIEMGFASISIQPKPIGMGDAIFTGFPIWSQAKRILVIWGDQVYVSEHTIKHALHHHAFEERTIALPLTRLAKPYVEYIFDEDGGLVSVKQSREGEQCSPNGLADVGTFVLSVKQLLSEWYHYMQQARPGTYTQEINFLPFLTFLASQGWLIKRVPVIDPIEARGINTPDDLQFFRHVYEGMAV